MNTVSRPEFISILVTIWAIWYARRKAIFDEEFQSPLSTYSFIRCFLADLEMAVPEKKTKEHRAVKKRGQAWIAPPQGMVKIMWMLL